MNGKTIITLLAGVALLTSLVPGAVAQANTLGISENDVRDEPNHGLDGNGFPHTEYSPQTPFPDAPLILESVYQVSAGVATEDVNNIVNRAQHGSDYGSYENHIYPGLGWFEAYWGWWHDKGSGGSLQEDQVTVDDGAAPDVRITGSPNGAIDDADDASADTWDEFVWRGNNPAATNFGYEQVGDDEPHDELYAFIQPGSHSVANAWLPNTTHPLDTHADGAGDPDFSFDDRTGTGGGWINANGFEAVFYDASLLMSTTVTVSANPGTAGDAYAPLTGERVDVDSFTTVNPAVEDLYRSTVWDPNNEDPNGATEAVHEEGVKAFLKHDYPQIVRGVSGQVEDAVIAAYRPADDAREPTQGTVDDMAMGPYKHEPNTQQDQYPAAQHDPATSYGGEPYYNPGPGQTYDHDTSEHVWADAQATWGTPFYGIVLWAPFGWNVDAGMPGEPGHRSQTPGVLQLDANLGSWYDRNGDTWVGQAADGYDLINQDLSHTGESDPYGHGVVDDPNQYYDANPDYSDDPEWYGTCEGNWKITLTPNTPGERWGATGVYVVQSRTDGGNTWDGDPTYDILTDTTGDTTVSTPAGDVTLKDEDGQLSQYVTQGPIELFTYCNDASGRAGVWFSHDQVIFPSGNLDYEVTIENVFTVGDKVVSHNGPNVGQSLSGESVVDVDVLQPFGQ